MSPQPVRVVREERPTEYGMNDLVADHAGWERMINFGEMELAGFLIKNTSTLTAVLQIGFRDNEAFPVDLNQGESQTWDTSPNEIWIQQGTTVTALGHIQWWYFDKGKKDGGQ